MLHLLADVLMLATRMDPPRRHPGTPQRCHTRHEGDRRAASGLTGWLRN